MPGRDLPSSSSPVSLIVDNGLEVGGLYRHFKGGVYQIVDFATCTQTLETTVIYKAYGESRLWSRPIVDFLALLNTRQHHCGRFEKLLF